MAEVEPNGDIVAYPFGVPGLSLAVSADVEGWALTLGLKVGGLALASVMAEAGVGDATGL